MSDAMIKQILYNQMCIMNCLWSITDDYQSLDLRANVQKTLELLNKQEVLK